MEPTQGSLLLDFLTFRVLMTPALLLVVYYLGAILVPLGAYWFYRKLTHFGQAASEALPTEALPRRGRLRDSLSEYKPLLIGAVVMMLVVGEIFWRMLFEFLIAYFQMHNALMQLTVSAGAS